MSLTQEDFKKHWSTAAISVATRNYIFIDNSFGSWVWVEFDGETNISNGTVSFDTSTPPRAKLNGSSTFVEWLSLAELSDGSLGLTAAIGHTLRFTSCVAIFDVTRDRNGTITKTPKVQKEFQGLKVTGNRVEIPKGYTALIRYNLQASSGLTFGNGDSWLQWDSYSKKPQVQLVRLTDQSVVLFDKVPAEAGDQYEFTLKAADGTDIDPILVVKAPPR